MRTVTSARFSDSLNPTSHQKCHVPHLNLSSPSAKATAPHLRYHQQMVANEKHQMLMVRPTENPKQHKHPRMMRARRLRGNARRRTVLPLLRLQKRVLRRLLPETKRNWRMQGLSLPTSPSSNRKILCSPSCPQERRWRNSSWIYGRRPSSKSTLGTRKRRKPFSSRPKSSHFISLYDSLCFLTVLVFVFQVICNTSALSHLLLPLLPHRSRETPGLQINLLTQFSFKPQ